MTAKRPRVATAHFEGWDPYDDDQKARVSEVADVIDWAPLARFDDERAAAVLAETDILLGHWGCPALDPAAVTAAPNLALFAYAAGTVKLLVDHHVFDRGIVVTSGASANARPVAEYTLAAILWANKNAFTLAAVTADPGAADPLPALAEPGNFDKRVGIIGASMVGRVVIDLLAAFDLRVVVSDPYLDPAQAEALGVELVELDELMATCDVVSLHAPILPSTIGMIDAARLAAMKDGATFINTARGFLVDHDALTAELVTGRISAVLDVTDPHEPIPPDWPPLGRSNVVVTPHLAGAQGTEVARLNDLAIEEIRRFAAGRPPAFGVTAADLDRIA
jgi:phosphoglycerate dehydrogenase-like enzyme